MRAIAGVDLSSEYVAYSKSVALIHVECNMSLFLPLCFPMIRSGSHSGK